MTWAKDKDKIMSIIMGIVTAGLIAAASMLVAHDSRISANEVRTENNTKAIDRIYDDTGEIKRDVKDILRRLKD